MFTLRITSAEWKEVIVYVFLSLHLAIFFNVDKSRFLIAIVTAALVTRKTLARTKWKFTQVDLSNHLKVYLGWIDDQQLLLYSPLNFVLLHPKLCQLQDCLLDVQHHNSIWETVCKEEKSQRQLREAFMVKKADNVCTGGAQPPSIAFGGAFFLISQKLFWMMKIAQKVRICPPKVIT